MSATIRRAVPDDLPAVARIYADAVLTSHATFDLVAPGVEAWEHRLATQGPLDAMFVAADPSGPGRDVVGFAYSSAYRVRAAYDRTRETTIYLADSARGQGLGSELYTALLETLAAAGVHTAIATIALPNPASEALHLAHGFTRAGHLVEVGHKFGRWVDIATYQRMFT
jgi:phosphinothricin acetyltransferase